MRRLVNFVRRSCAISFKPVRSRYNSKLEELKQSFRRILRRKLTAREEQLLELSESMLGTDLDDSPRPEQKRSDTEAA